MTVDENTINDTLSVFGDNKKKLVELTLIDGDRLIDEIDKACKDRDTEAAAFAAHSLKSITKQIGALSVSSIAEKIERFGNEGDIDACIGQWDTLHEHYTSTRNYLTTFV